MAIEVYQTNIVPVGHFDIKDSDLQNIVGGEVLVLDQTVDPLDAAAPDVYQNGSRAQLRLATRFDTGPFFFAKTDRGQNQYSTPAFETSSLFSRNSGYARTIDASSKVSFFLDEGFYAISRDAFDDGYISTSTPSNAKLYVNSQGLLTTNPSFSRAIVGYFVEYRSDSVVNNNLNRPFKTAGSFKETDTIIVYKTNADGYIAPEDILSLVSDQAIIGEPDDGYYTDGFFPFTSETRIANAVDDINELLFAIAPAAPGDLTSQDLDLSGTTTYSAILPSGLSAAWYSGGDSAGDTISNYIVDNTYLLSSPDTATRFNGGRLADTSELGTLTHVVNGADGYQRDIAANGVGTTGTITITDISAYNTIWNKINAQVSVTQSAEGRETHALRHTLAGTSNTIELFYDPVNTAPAFDSGPTASEDTPVDGYLSGIIHYSSGSTFDVSYTAASGIFNRAYDATQVSRIEVPGASNTTVNPSSVPAFGDTFIVTDENISLNSANVVSESPSFTVRLFKPNGDTASATASLSRPINTYGTASTSTTELFVDETQRLSGIGSTSPDWTSSNALTDGEAQVYITGSSGVVGFPRTSDYPGFVASEQVYQRHFTKAAASSANLVFTGISVGDIDPYGTGDLNVVLRLDDDDLYFDAGLAFGASNGDGSGDSFANSIGCQVGSSSGSSLDITFGVESTANNSGRYRVILIFRNNNHTVEQIVTS